MKDLFGAFGPELFRPLATLLLPGAVSLAPGVLVTFWSVEWAQNFVAHSQAEAVAVFTLFSLFVGLVLEDWGSRIEWGIFNLQTFCEEVGTSSGERRWLSCAGAPFRGCKGTQGEKEWYEYLRLAYDVEPVGHRYMRTVVLRLKFELGCCAACFLAILGIWLSLPWSSLASPIAVRAIWSGCFAAGGVYFYWESWTTVRRLRRLRTEMLKRMGVTAIAAHH